MLGVRKSTCNEFPCICITWQPTLKSEVYKRQSKFYLDYVINKDLPMQRYIIRKALDTKCNFMKHSITIRTMYIDPNDKTSNSTG